MGDYYRPARGDYYRGDPGLFSFLKKGVRSVGRVAQKAVGIAASGLVPSPVAVLLRSAYGGGAGGAGGGAMTPATPRAMGAAGSPVLHQASILQVSPTRATAARRKRRRTTRRVPPGTTRTASGRYRSAFLSRRRTRR